MTSVGAKTTIEGIQEAQAKNLRIAAALRPSGAAGRVVRFVTLAAHRYATGITHVCSGALRASHRVKLGGKRGQIYIDPASVSPTGGRPSIYGPIEHARGGDHAFYSRVETEAGDMITRQALYTLKAEAGL